jgi:hypothetical protein
MTPHGFIEDDDKALKKYKAENSKAWAKILGGGEFDIVEEEESMYDDITTFTQEPE